MDSESGRDGSRRYALVLGLLLAAALGLVAVLAAPKVYRFARDHDPYVMERADNAAAQRLVQGCTREPRLPLTSEEFGLAVTLLRSPETIAQLSAMSVVAVAVERDPTRREAALAALATCSNPEDPWIAAAAGRTIARMTAPPATPADKEPKADAD